MSYYGASSIRASNPRNKEVETDREARKKLANDITKEIINMINDHIRTAHRIIALGKLEEDSNIFPPVQIVVTNDGKMQVRELKLLEPDKEDGRIFLGRYPIGTVDQLDSLVGLLANLKHRDIDESSNESSDI